jgi:hypothetical protein
MVMRYIIIIFTFVLLACTNQVEASIGPDDSTGQGDDVSKSVANPNQKHSVYGPWSASGKILTRSSQRVSLQTPDLPTDDYTVSFDLSIPPGLNNNQAVVLAQVDALIQASVDGVTISRRVSVVNGTMLTVAAERVTVQISDRSIALGGSPSDYQYDVSVGVARGSRPSVNQPPVFLPTPFPGPATGAGATGTLAPGAQAIWTFPDDSGAISVYVSGVVQVLGGVNVPTQLKNGDLTVSQNRRAGPISTPTDIALASFDASSGNSGWVPLVPGCNEIIVINHTDSDGLNQNINYAIWIGIDG